MSCNGGMTLAETPVPVPLRPGTDLESKPGFHAESSATNRLSQGTDGVCECRHLTDRLDLALQLSLVTPNTLSVALFDMSLKQQHDGGA